MGRKPFDGISDARGVGLAYEDAVAAIVIDGGAKVPAGGAMSGPGFTYLGLFMDEDLGSDWSQWGAIEIEGTMELGLGRQLGVDAGASEQVQSDECLWEDPAP